MTCLRFFAVHIGFIRCRIELYMYMYFKIIFMPIVAIVLMTGSLTSMVLVKAQTPTTSDLPATVGNETNMDGSLSNHTLPVENATTVIPITPP